MFSIARLSGSGAKNQLDLAFDVRFVVGRRAKTIAGFAPAAMNGTPSTHGRSVPGLSPPLDGNPMPFVHSLVTPFELV